jgi:hypothetical protein
LEKERLARGPSADLQEYKPKAAISRPKGLAVAYFEAFKLPPSEVSRLIETLNGILPGGVAWGRSVQKRRR